jgi:hypothetical protein
MSLLVRRESLLRNDTMMGRGDSVEEYRESEGKVNAQIPGTFVTSSKGSYRIFTANYDAGGIGRVPVD